MAAAGEYDTRLEWFKKTQGGVDEFGQRHDEFYPSQGYLWGAVEAAAAGRSSEMESERQETTATVRLRNFPAVAAGDRLRDRDGNEWTIETVLAGDNEVVCEVVR